MIGIDRRWRVAGGPRQGFRVTSRELQNRGLLCNFGALRLDRSLAPRARKVVRVS